MPAPTYGATSPGLPETEVERIVWSYLDNVGRQMAEFSQLHKLIPQNRITFSGFEVASRLVGEVPTISLVLHLANWEVLGPGMKKLGLPIASFYEPPNDPFPPACGRGNASRFRHQAPHP